MIGWWMVAVGLFALAAILLGTGGVGAGGRRTSAKAALAAANEENRRLREQITELKAAINPIPSFEEIAAADALDTTPKFDQPALADTPGAWTSIPDATPADPEHLLTGLCDDKTLALPTVAPVADVEKTQVMSVAQVRNAVAAAAPVRLDPVPPVTWPRKASETAQIEAALSLPGPPPGAGASEISMATGLKAVTQVHAVVTEAAS